MQQQVKLDPVATRIMGILNVTPDSFSDGGEFDRVDTAVAHGLEMAAQGAQLIDVGGESTRPGAKRINDDEQCQRVVPVIEGLKGSGVVFLQPLSSAECSLQKTTPDPFNAGLAISVDTTRAAVAEVALDAGATWVNDVSAGREDSRMFEVVADRSATMVLMHMQGEPGTMQKAPRYDDVVGEVVAFLERRIEAALDAGIASDKIVIDPGIGFGKTLAHNLALLGHLDRFVAMGYPVMLGASRKRFIAEVCPNSANENANDRLGGTLATTILAAQAGVAWVRVHDVQPNYQAIEVLRSVGAGLARTPAEDR